MYPGRFQLKHALLSVQVIQLNGRCKGPEGLLLRPFLVSYSASLNLK